MVFLGLRWPEAILLFHVPTGISTCSYPVLVRIHRKVGLCKAWPPLQSVNSSSLLPRGRFVARGYVIKNGKSVLVSSSESGSPWRCYNFLVSTHFLDKGGTAFHMKHWSTWSGQFVQVTQIQSVLVCHGGGTATLLVTLAVVFWSQPATAHSTICHFKGCVRRAKREHRNGCNSKTCWRNASLSGGAMDRQNWITTNFWTWQETKMLNEIWPKLQFYKSAGYICDMSLSTSLVCH